MPAFTARHVIFSRIEYAYSPHKKTGYQVFYASPGLSHSDVTFIEKRVQCFNAVHSESIRHQYFGLDSGQVAITSSKPLVPGMAEFNEVIDKTGREGAFIAHALVLSKTQFKQLQYNPFMVIDNVRFIQTIEDLLTHQNTPQKGVAVHASDVSQSTLPSGWTTTHLEMLYTLGLSNQKEQTLLLKGQAADVLQLIRQAVLLANMDTRLLLTFDTLADHCAPPKQVFWAVGSSRTLRKSYFVEVDLKNPKLTALTRHKRESDMYDSWIRGVSSQNSHISDDILASAQQVQAVSSAFDNKEALPSSIKPGVLTTIIQYNYDFVQARFSKAVDNFTSSNLGQLLAKDFLDDKLNSNHIEISTAQLMTVAAQGKIDAPQVMAHSIYQGLIMRKQTVPGASAKKLAQIGQRYAVPELEVFALLSQAGQNPLTKLIGQLLGVAERDARQLSTALNQLNAQSQLASVLDDMQRVLGRSLTQRLKQIIHRESLDPDVDQFIQSFQKG